MDQPKEDKINIYIPAWGTDEWICCGTESLSQYIHRVKLMNQRLGASEITSDEIGTNHNEVKVLPMKFYGEEFSKDDIITFQRENHNDMDPNAVAVYQKRGEHKIHVSYVCKEDSKRVTYIPNLEEKTLKLVESCDKWSKLEFC